MDTWHSSVLIRKCDSVQKKSGYAGLKCQLCNIKKIHFKGFTWMFQLYYNYTEFSFSVVKKKHCFRTTALYFNKLNFKKISFIATIGQKKRKCSSIDACYLQVIQMSKVQEPLLFLPIHGAHLHAHWTFLPINNHCKGSSFKKMSVLLFTSQLSPQ